MRAPLTLSLLPLLLHTPSVILNVFKRQIANTIENALCSAISLLFRIRQHIKINGSRHIRRCNLNRQEHVTEVFKIKINKHFN